MATSYSSSRRLRLSMIRASHLETLNSFCAARTRTHRAMSSGNVMVMFFMTRK